MDENDLLKKLLWPLTFMSIISSMAGISLMLRNNEEVRPRDVAQAILASVAVCAIVYLLLVEYLADTPYLLYGVASLAGAGGASTLDLLFIMLRRYVAKKGLTAKPDDDAGQDGPEEA